ncbi:uncharacterized protein LOC132273660 isoform X2 [Cornus florida]|uniref:uncharacterized protein LOC132273660 isoform X2 n=1 Tax=Cornus florida TaxID=4283 RepID=UPI00289FCC52|nr:uncharacterized protein LOC132273660 isoform X2 [Cornus florida]
MEHPPFLRHPPRYVPLAHPPPPPPPPPPNFSDDHRNLYPNHHHLPPPPPPPQSHRPLPPFPPPPPLPPPPSYLPQSQFTFLNRPHPIEDKPRKTHLFDFTRHHSPPPRVSTRTLIDDDRPRLRIPEFDNSYPDSRHDSWVDPPRFPTQDRSARPVSLGFDHEPHHHRSFDNQTSLSTHLMSNKYLHKVEGSSRFKDDFSNRFKHNNTEELFWGRNSTRRGDDSYDYSRGRDNYILNSSGSSRNSALGDFSHVSSPNPSRDFAGNLGKYESCYGSVPDNERMWNSRDENRRGVHSRLSSRELPKIQMEMEGNKYGNGDENQVFSMGRGTRTYDSGKFSGRGSREGTQDFVPWKQVQKKSALLRIQLGKPNNRNRTEDRLFSSVYFDDSAPSTLRGRGPLDYLDHSMEDDGEGSPVELDVSFKSNALVAKAIAAPPSQSVVSDRNLTPRNRKIRNGMGLSYSPLTKLSENHVESDSYIHVSEYPSSSYKGSKQSEEKVMDSGGGAVCDIDSQPCFNGPNDLPRDSRLKGSFSDKAGNSVGSEGTCLLRARKKKRVVSSLSRASSSEPTKKNFEPVNVDFSSNSPSAASRPDGSVMHSKEKFTSAGMGAMREIVFQSSPNDVSALLESSEVAEIVSETDGTNNHSGRTYLSDTKRKRNSSDPPLGSSSPLETRTDKDAVNADGAVDGLHTISNSVNGLIELHNGSTFYDHDNGRVDGDSQQSCQNGLPVLLESGLVKGSLESMVSVGDRVNAATSSVETITIHQCPVNTYSSVNGLHNASSSDNGFIKRPEKISVSGFDAGWEPPLLNQVTVALENGAMEEFSKTIPSVRSNTVVGSSSAEKTKIHSATVNVDGSNHDAITTLISSNGLTDSEGKVTVSDAGPIDDSSKHSCLDEATILLGNGFVEVPPNVKVSVEDGLTVNSGEEHTAKVTRKRKIGNKLGLSSPSTGDVPLTTVTSEHSLDTPLSCPDKDLVFTEGEVIVSGDGRIDASSQPCTDNISIFNGNSLIEGSQAELSVRGGVISGPDGITPICNKKRKVLAPSLFSQMLPDIQEGPVNADACISSADMPLNIDKGLTESEDKIAVSSIDTICSAGLPPYSNSITKLNKGTATGGSFESMNLVGDGFTDNTSNLEHESPCPSGLGSEQKEMAALGMATANLQSDIDMESGSRGETTAAAPAVEEHGMLHIETAQHEIPLRTRALDWEKVHPGADIECNSNLLVKNDFFSVSDIPSLCADHDVVSTTNSSDDPMESVPDTLSTMGSPETLNLGSHVFFAKSSFSQISNEEVCGDDQKQNTNINVKSGHAMVYDTSLLSQDTMKTTQTTISKSEKLNIGKNQATSAVPRVFPGQSFLHFNTSKKTVPSSQTAKPRTWHRTGNPSAFLPGKNSHSSHIPPQGQSFRFFGKVQSTSYIRKGNSLVRKPSPVAAPPHGSHVFSSSVYRLNPSGKNDIKKSTGSESRVDVIDPPNCLRAGLNATAERPKTPPLPCSTKLSSCTTISSRDCTSSSLADPPQSGGTEITSDQLTENMDIHKSSEDAPKISGTPENQSGLTNNLEGQSARDEGNSASVTMKKIMYVKRKSNQLVVASNSSDLSIQDANKTQVLSSNGYYKRRKNQLIRKSLESHTTQRVAVADESLNSEEQRASKVFAGTSSSKRRSGKGLAKTYKPSKFSLVWTLCDTQSSKKDNSLQHQKMLPQLFPWKRATYCRSFMHNSALISNNSSLSSISRKLLLSRKRDTIYTRSMRGFSLRRLKVLSVDGTSLKWSKSIERNSRKANEEATLAVAAAEKKKREQNGAACVLAGTKSRNHSSRERIFRIGSVRYKMDPTRRTLQRISDEELSRSDALQFGKNAKKPYVPRRLMIGNDEYVRIGNGNKLIRDPKKRTRILASEKVRWSLHTARLRLARKRQYCQFFTRFGKCNKDDGKCPYIHDPSKIAVCTKFLNGSCSNPNCKLTHKVIPERMQDCSYFLQGLCNNESCPYRHVNVNPNSSICEGFLRGYCADGDECRKKHSYVCPIFEATGICPQGSNCKLHHPKNRTKGKKKKPPREQKNTQGRYFGSRHIDFAECRMTLSEKHSAKDDDDDIFFQEGRFADYISLDVSDEEDGETGDSARERTTLSDGDFADAQVDEIIKPIRIMNKNLTTESSPATNCPSKKTPSYVSEESNLL